ncbi:uncharacterized protein SPPG_02778 [Spizellomyces punctatus DAOM BR117]|uniref:RRM domain-containing protein n=1 Tax=Spizellomyces punctatus (strain DAOM BR117) TaxID=645134 RepID=A0A0L0HNB4_SPIPD|nr:uncharacterized protein SPPG_02778 [Spizellomyces punctatus DAOM BR117]KND02304.1 hypothetical protein SPPG_02778 [Spizellomyces punctatus DAOM BR117]|eukprot:XP_016610343.1 hypothetical protein SPPG_02778 [Spizellomyces punctatus DAOM BR117]
MKRPSRHHPPRGSSRAHRPYSTRYDGRRPPMSKKWKRQQTSLLISTSLLVRNVPKGLPMERLKGLLRCPRQTEFFVREESGDAYTAVLTLQKSEAMRILNDLNYQDIDNHIISLEVERPEDYSDEGRIRISGLPSDVTAKELWEIYRRFGVVLLMKIYPDYTAQVLYSEPSAAQRAIQETTSLLVRNGRLRPALYAEPRGLRPVRPIGISVPQNISGRAIQNLQRSGQSTGPSPAFARAPPLGPAGTSQSHAQTPPPNLAYQSERRKQLRRPHDGMIPSKRIIVVSEDKKKVSSIPESLSTSSAPATVGTAALESTQAETFRTKHCELPTATNPQLANVELTIKQLRSKCLLVDRSRHPTPQLIAPIAYNFLYCQDLQQDRFQCITWGAPELMDDPVKQKIFVAEGAPYPQLGIFTSELYRPRRAENLQSTLNTAFRSTVTSQTLHIRNKGRIKCPEHPMVSIRCLPNENLLITSDEGSFLSVWDFRTTNDAKTTMSLKIKSGQLSGRIDVGERKVVSGGSDGFVHIWDVDGSDTLHHRNAMLPVASHDVGLPGRITCTSIHDRSARVITAATDEGSLNCIDIRMGRSSASSLITGAHRGYVTALQCHPRTEYLVLSGSDDCTVRMWDMRGKHTPVKQFTHDDKVTAVEWCPHLQDIFLSSSTDGRVIIHHKEKPQVVQRHVLHGAPVIGASWNPDPNFEGTIASLSPAQDDRPGSIHVWRGNGYIQALAEAQA